MGLAGKKARRDADRLLFARRRDTLLRLLSLSVPLLMGWKYGLNAARGVLTPNPDVTNVTEAVVEEIKALPVRERRYIAMNIGLVEKARTELVEELGVRGEIDRRGGSFFLGIREDLDLLSNEVLDQNDRYGLMTKLDDMKSLTYLIFMSFCDWGNNKVLSGEQPPKCFDNFVSRFRVLADYLIEEGNVPLRQSMSNAYWNTRNELHAQPSRWWDDNDPDLWCWSAEEVRQELKKKGEKTCLM